jgi:carboxylesterase
MNPVESFKRVFDQPQHHPFTLRGTHDAAALLVHGFPGTPADMRAVAEALHRAGWTAQGLLLPGFGPDIETLPTRSAEDWRDAITTALKALRAQHKTVLLIGHSMGGALSIDAATRVAPDGVALLSPFWKLDGALWALLPLLKVAIPQFQPFRLMKLDFNSAETRANLARYMRDADFDDPAVQTAIKGFSLPTNMIDQVRRTGVNAAQAAPKLRVPALIVQGTEDALVKPDKTRLLAQKIAPHAQYHEVCDEHQLIDPRTPSYPAVERLLLDFAAALLPQTEPTQGTN